MTGLTTLFAVGPEEYVEFHESLGSKAFLEHVWDQSTTPLSQQGESWCTRCRQSFVASSFGADPAQVARHQS